MRSPGPASRQPLIVSNRPYRLTRVRADLHENPNRSAKEESVGAGFQCQLLPRSRVPLNESSHAGNTDPSQRASSSGITFRGARPRPRPVRGRWGLTPRSGDAPTVGDWETVGRKGQAGQKTVPEPAGMRQPQVAAIGQSDALPRTPHGQWSVPRQRVRVNTV